MPENRPAHMVKELTPGMSGYVMPSAIKIDDDQRYWVDPLAGVIVHRVLIQSLEKPPTGIKVMRSQDGYQFRNQGDDADFAKGDGSELKGWIPITLVG